MSDFLSQAAEYELFDDSMGLRFVGEWTTRGIERLQHQFDRIVSRSAKVELIDGSGLTRLDSAGALVLYTALVRIRDQGRKIKVTGFTEQQQALLAMIARDADNIIYPSVTVKPSVNPLVELGEKTLEKGYQLTQFLSFLGELTVSSFSALLSAKRTLWSAVLKAVDESGYRALPIVGLMAFLIGLVLAYQLGVQLQTYGANIYVVDVVGVAVLREFGPLITAIILAGRTSTSFAALIGTMVVNEEIDALRVMGMSPVRRLVLPRVLGLIVVFPLLIVWADIFGVLGSMVTAKSMFHVNYIAFLQRFEYEIALKQYVLGLIKAPVFAVIIATVGCFQGFAVKGSADSVGRQTTKAAVQAIFLIIIADAAFSIIFSVLGL